MIVTIGVHHAAADQFNWGPSESVEIKGRKGVETVFPVTARKTPEKAQLANGDLQGNFDPHP